jgi:hypothetical protein
MTLPGREKRSNKACQQLNATIGNIGGRIRMKKIYILKKSLALIIAITIVLSIAPAKAKNNNLEGIVSSTCPNKT